GGRPGGRPRRPRPRAPPAQRGRPQPGQPSQSVPLSHALPQGPAAVQSGGAAAGGQGQRHAGRLPFPPHPRGGNADRRTIIRAVSAQASEIGQPGTEAQGLLQALIRFNTVNPPGNELVAQEFIAEHLTDAGFRCELLAAEPGRPNLVARLSGDGRAAKDGGPRLCYLGHVDTVLADPSEWTHDPWSG